MSRDSYRDVSGVQNDYNLGSEKSCRCICGRKERKNMCKCNPCEVNLSPSTYAEKKHERLESWRDDPCSCRMAPELIDPISQSCRPRNCKISNIKAFDKCSCDSISEFDDNFAPGISYVPYQKWCGIMGYMESLEKGTIFKELALPFLGSRKGRY